MVDTGADVTTLPKTIIPILGLNEKSLKRTKTQGVGGIWIETFETKLPIRLGNDEFPIHISIANTKEESLPFLLGRKDIFEKRYSLEINSKMKVTILNKN
ncbi:hypothetical protein HYU92_03470 [Candidatus Curtissbacteria bacterium]|nr:hypothetical protein [Candidatus Curtissbacteria bacterium]